MNATFDENKYLDILQNIEFALASVYREHPEMTDYNADKVVEVIIREYKAEKTGHPAPANRLQGVDEVTYERLTNICEWRLGRGKLDAGTKKRFLKSPPPIALIEMIACLKRVQKSIRLWQKEGGRRGYFYFIDQFVR